MTPIMNKLIATAALSLALTASQAAICYADGDDYFERRDTITQGAGDANATNFVTQTIDPWPPYARNTKIMVDGTRARLGMTRYQHNKSIEPHGLTGSGATGASGGSEQGSGTTK